MEPTQIMIIVSLLAVTGVFVYTGIWFVNILKEFKITITKVNGILDDTKLITESVSQPVSSFSEFLMGFKNGFTLFNSLFKKKQQDE